MTMQPQLQGVSSNVAGPWCRDGLVEDCVLLSGNLLGLANLNGVVWPSGDAQLYPFRLHAPAIARKAILDIALTSGGGIDVGIYDQSLRLLVSSGSTPWGTTGAVQEIDLTDTPLGPGRYYLALAGSSSGNVRAASFDTSFGKADRAMFAGILKATVFPLPAVFTPDASAWDLVPILGLILDSAAL